MYSIWERLKAEQAWGWPNGGQHGTRICCHHQNGFSDSDPPASDPPVLDFKGEQPYLASPIILCCNNTLTLQISTYVWVFES